MTTDRNTLLEYANRLHHIKNALRNVSIVQIDKTKKVAVELMEELQKEYHVK